MSDLVSDADGSAHSTVEPASQLRLVSLSPACNGDHLTDDGPSLSSSKTESNSGLHHKETSVAVDSIPSESLPADKRPVASEHEVRDLLHVVDKVPTRLWIACIAGILERFVWYGATAPLRACHFLPASMHESADLDRTENYLQHAPGGEVPGALGLGQATASNIVNALMIGSYLTPVPAAVVADSWLGRYKTMVYSAMYCDGLSNPSSFHPLWLMLTTV